MRRIKRLFWKLVLGMAHRLPAARGLALVTGTEAAITLVTGRRSGTARAIGKPGDPASRRAPSNRRGNEADETDGAEDEPENIRVLELRAAALAEAGEISERAAVLHRLHQRRHDPAVRVEERAAVGQLVQTAPGWLPLLPGPAQPVRPMGDDVVLYLVKESDPYRRGPSTVRLRDTLQAAVQAGLRPEVATALGFPRSMGVVDFPRLELVDGIPHHRLDLGPHYPLDRPADLLLKEMAWLTAELVRRVRPAIIHAVPGDDGFDLALVGAALREHLRLPLVYEGPRREAGASDESRRRHATATRAMQLADHVIVSDEGNRDGMIADGIDPEHVTVIPSGIDAGPRLRAVYTRVLEAWAAQGAS